MKCTRTSAPILLAAAMILQLCVTAGLADTVKIGSVNVTETAKDFGWVDVDWIHKLTVHNKSDLLYITSVEKMVPGYPPGEVDPHGKTGWIVEKEGVDTDKDGTEDSTRIRWWGGSISGASTSETFTFDTETGVLGFTKNTVTIKTARGPLDPGPTYEGEVTVQKEKEKPGEKKAEAASSSGGKVSFDATTSRLSFSGDTIIDTGFPGDPLIGSFVTLPDFQYVGASADGKEELFGISTDEYLTIGNGTETYMKANMAFLTYVVSDNLFYGSMFDFSLAGVDSTSPFYSPLLPAVDSPWLARIDSVFDPSSPGFDPAAAFYFTFRPEQNFWNSTAGFSATAESLGSDGMYPAEPVPEPSIWFHLASGLAVSAWVRKRRLLKK